MAGKRKVLLQGDKMGLAVKCRGGGLIRLRYRKFRDKDGKVKRQLVGPIVLTSSPPKD